MTIKRFAGSAIPNNQPKNPLISCSAGAGVRARAGMRMRFKPIQIFPSWQQFYDPAL
jgi:hypothetical protein